MKPEIFFVNEKDGMVSISKEDLQLLINRIYEAGKIDGLNIPPYITTPTNTQPYTITPTWNGVENPSSIS